MKNPSMHSFIATLALGLTLSGTVLATDSTPETIDQARVLDDGSVSIRLSSNSNGCSGDMISINNPTSVDGALKMALAAFLSGKRVKGVSGTCTSTEGGTLTTGTLWIMH